MFLDKGIGTFNGVPVGFQPQLILPSGYSQFEFVHLCARLRIDLNIHGTTSDFLRSPTKPHRSPGPKSTSKGHGTPCPY